MLTFGLQHRAISNPVLSRGSSASLRRLPRRLGSRGIEALAPTARTIEIMEGGAVRAGRPHSTTGGPGVRRAIFLSSSPRACNTGVHAFWTLDLLRCSAAIWATIGPERVGICPESTYMQNVPVAIRATATYAQVRTKRASKGYLPPWPWTQINEVLITGAKFVVFRWRLLTRRPQPPSAD